MTNELIIQRLEEVAKHNNTAGWQLLRIARILEHARQQGRLSKETFLVKHSDRSAAEGYVPDYSWRGRAEQFTVGDVEDLLSSAVAAISANEGELAPIKYLVKAYGIDGIEAVAQETVNEAEVAN